MPAVWCTLAKRIAGAYGGAPLRIDSSAPQALRGTIGGDPAEATARSGILSSGLRTNDARRSRTRPVMR